MTRERDNYGWTLGWFTVGHRLDYRRTWGAWCEHPAWSGQLVDMGMRKLWTCDVCGHSTFTPARP